ncbi:MAG: hypothetical protein WC506_00490 [Candidatus Micrarchaeia archaeon]
MARNTKTAKVSTYTSTPVDNREMTLGMLDSISRMSGASFSVERVGEEILIRLEKERKASPYIVIAGEKKQVMEIY